MMMKKIGKILLWLTTWMSRLDRMISPDRCCTNPYLATFLLYVFLVLGAQRAVLETTSRIGSVDDVYLLMSPENRGMGLMCLIFLMAETIMLYGSLADMLVRFVVIVMMANIFYVMGLFMPITGPVLIRIIAIAYIYTFIIIIRDTMRRIRHEHTHQGNDVSQSL